MTFYQRLNHFLELIDQSLATGLDLPALAQKSHLSYTTLQKVFPLLTDMTLAEYVRSRKLTLAGKDLVQTNLRVLDLAYKYGYESTESFSRAFYKFHHLTPRDARRHAGNLRSLARPVFTMPALARDITYEVVELPRLELYGFGVQTDKAHITTDAPQLFQRIECNYPSLPHPEYGLLRYASGRDNDNNYYYYVLWQQQPHLTTERTIQQIIPAAKWLKFRIRSQEATDIQRETNAFYEDFLPTCDYRLRNQPDLEYYHDGITDFLIPID